MSHYTRAELEEMPVKNQASMLDGLNLKDPEAVRRFMQGLEYHLTHTVLNMNYEEMLGLCDFELAKIVNIVACIRDNGLAYPLLAEASIRFISQRHRDPKSVLLAGWDFDEFASEAALTIPDMYPHEYGLAEARMVDLRGSIDIMRIKENLYDLIPGAFSEQVYHVRRATELEKMAKDFGGDIRSIAPEIQLEPHPIPSGDSAKNPEYCYHCTRDNKYCDRVEPKCSCCRERWLDCTYDNPVLKKKDEKEKNVEMTGEENAENTGEKNANQNAERTGEKNADETGEKTAEVIEDDQDIQYDEDIGGLEDIEDGEGIEDGDESIVSSLLSLAAVPTSNSRQILGAGTIAVPREPAEESAIEQLVVDKSTTGRSVTEKLASQKPKIKLTIGKKPSFDTGAIEKASVEKSSPFKEPAAQKASALKKATAENGVIGKTSTKKVTIDEKVITKKDTLGQASLEKANSKTVIIENPLLQKAPVKIATAGNVTAKMSTVERVDVEKVKSEKSAGTKLIGPKSEPLNTKPPTATTSKNTKPEEVVTSIPAPKKTFALKPAKILPTASDRVTRRMARSNPPNTGDHDPDSGPPFNNEDGHASAAATSKSQGTKRKQQITDDDENDDKIGLVNSRPSKRANQPAKRDPILSVKRTSANTEIDDDSNSQPIKKAKLSSNTNALPSGVKNDDDGGKRTVRGRPEQDHEGKKCCNTCQGWKPLSEFAIKKHSKTPGTTVGYCKRCQANKQAKNKAKADAKKGAGQVNTATSIVVDDDIDDGDAVDLIYNENGNGI